MATVSEVTTLPAELGDIISEKKVEKTVTDEETGKSDGSVAVASVLSQNGTSRISIWQCQSMPSTIRKTNLVG